MKKSIMPDKLGMPDVTDEIRLALHKKYAKPYIIYRKHKTYVDCYCTHCMKRYRLYLDRELNTPDDVAELDMARHIVHNAVITCWNCGCIAVAKAEKISRKGLTDYHFLCYFFAEKNAVYAVCGALTCGYGYKQSIDEMEKNYGGSKWDKFYVMEYTPGNARLIGRNWYGEFEEKSKIYEPYLIVGGFYSFREYFAADNTEVLKDTFLKYVLPVKYMDLKSDTKYTAYKKTSIAYDGCYPLKYMAYAVKYPAVEMLLKAGGREIVYDIIDRSKPYKRVIDLEGKTAAEVFRTYGNEAAIIRGAMRENNVDLNTLQCWYRLKAAGRREKHKYKFEDAIALCKLYFPYHTTLQFINKTGLTPKKYMNYIMRQAELNNICPSTVETIYRDYIKDCETLQYDLCDTQISKPADLYEAHNMTTGLLHAIYEERARKEEAKKLAKYQKLREKLCKKYEYSDEKYMIVVPEGAWDIAEEGKRLHHCVGGYAERHIKGATTILFMRDVQAPKVPLYTIEIYGNELKQIHGFKNCDPAPDAKKFVQKWLRHLKRSKKQKQPEDETDGTNAA